MKLFHRIAITAIGILLAGSSMALIGKATRNMSRVDAVTDSYHIEFSTTYGDEPYMDGDASGALTTATIVKETTYTDSGKTITFNSIGFDNVASIDRLDNIYAGRNNSIKVGKGGGDGVMTLTYAGNINLRSVSITAFALESGIKLTVDDVETDGTQTLDSGMENAKAYDFDFPDDYVGKQLTITGGKGKTSSNKPAYIQSITATYEEISDPVIIPAAENYDVGVSESVEVGIEYANLSENISVSIDDDTIAEADTNEITIDGTGAGVATVNVDGLASGVATMTLSSGSASVDVTLNVVDLTVYTLVEDLNTLTDGSTFTLVGYNKAGSKYFYATAFNSNYYETAEATHLSENKKVLSALNAKEFTLMATEDGALIKDDTKYLGATSISSTSKLTLTDAPTSAFHLFDVQPVEDSVMHDITLIKGESEGNSNKINFNTSNSRITNYAASNPSIVAIYANYLAPALYVDDECDVEIGTPHYVTLNPVNFGGEAINYSFESSNEDVATASQFEQTVRIEGIAPGEATITVTAQSEHHGPVEATITVTVINAGRVLTGLNLSVNSDTLYKGQEFSYSGNIQAVYSDLSTKDLAHNEVTFTGYDMSTTGDQTVTVSYSENEVNVHESYTLTVQAWTGALTIGNYYVLASNYTDAQGEHSFSMVGITVINNKSVGNPAEYTTTLRSECAMKVEQGSTYNSYSFVLGDGKYLATGNDAILNKSETKNGASSWTVVSDGDNYTITNVEYSTRIIQYNSGNPRFATYTTTQKKVTLIEREYTDVVADFSVNFLHPEIAFDNNADTGACRDDGDNKGYYSLAKEAFNVMPVDSREFFLNSSIYANYAARLAAWAEANGETFDTNNMLTPVDGATPFVMNMFKNNNIMLLVLITVSVVTVSMVGFYFVMRRRKHQ